MKKVVALEDIHLYGVTIPKGAVGSRSQWKGRLKFYKDSESAAVKFPEYTKKPFVTLAEQIQDI